jgi:hypothetical protein
MVTSKVEPYRIKAFLLKAYDYTCQYCCGTFAVRDLQVDHIEPKSSGGEDRLENYTLACRGCNKRKGDMALPEWALSLLVTRAKELIPEALMFLRRPLRVGDEGGRPIQFWLHDEDRRIVREVYAWLAGQGIRATDSIIIRAALRTAKTGSTFLEACQQALQADGRLKENRPIRRD